MADSTVGRLDITYSVLPKDVDIGQTHEIICNERRTTSGAEPHHMIHPLAVLEPNYCT